MKERTFAAQDYTYGFNGQEQDTELLGDMYNFGARLYNSRLGKWLGVDPLANKYPNLSPYNFVENSPLVLIDLDGQSPSSPILDRKGNFLCTDSEGFKGDIVIMDADKYQLLTNNGKKILNHEQVMIWAKVSPHTETLDDYVANTLSFDNKKTVMVVENILTNLLIESEKSGIIDLGNTTFSGNKVFLVKGGFPLSSESGQSVTVASSDHSSETFGKVSVFVLPASRTEYKEGIIVGTQSLWFIGNSGDAINILGIHEKILHGRKHEPTNSNEAHVKIYEELLYNPKYKKSLELTTKAYRDVLKKHIAKYKKK